MSPMNAKNPMNRRTFLGGALAAGGILALPRLGFADPAKRGSPRRTLVLLHLNGGNDGLNTVVPYTDARYRTLRPGIAHDPSRVLKIDKKLGLHPGLTGFQQLWNKDRLAIVNGAGYPQPNLSHFRATEIWFTAEPEKTPTYGWLGRALDARKSDKPLRAVALEKERPLTFAMAGTGSVTMTNFQRFRVPSGMETAAALYRDYAGREDNRAPVGEAGASAIKVARRIASLKPSDGPFYGALGNKLRQVNALLEADLDLECIQISFGGFDTHSNQTASHQRLMTQLGNNLRAYQERLEQKGVADRTVLVVMSEFGRRANENLSGGTDHGTAGPVFVIGTGIKPGFHGAQPSLDDLERDNLKYTTDFRRIYAAVLQHAFDLDPRPILGAHDPLELFV